MGLVPDHHSKAINAIKQITHFFFWFPSAHRSDVNTMSIICSLLCAQWHYILKNKNQCTYLDLKIPVAKIM